MSGAEPVSGGGSGVGRGLGVGVGSGFGWAVSKLAPRLRRRALRSRLASWLSAIIDTP